MDDAISPRDFESAVGGDGWRVIGDGACAFYPTTFGAGVQFAGAIAGLEGIDAHSPDIDLRADGVTVRLVTATADWFGMTGRDLDLARRISEVADDLGLMADPTRVQSLLIVPGAPSAADVMPFWQALLGYEPRPDSPDEDLVDPRNRHPGFWFEDMHEPRADGGGSIHVAVWVAADQAEARVAAALAAGGRMVRDEHAPSWWTLADAAGNEADVSSIDGRA